MEIDYAVIVEPVSRWQHLQPPQTPRERIEGMIRQMAGSRGVRLDEVMSVHRDRRISEARQEIMWALREMGFSYPHIGQMLNRDHTTIIHGVRRHRERMAARQSYD